MSVLRRLRLVNRDGLHARPIARVVEVANQFQSRLSVRHGSRSADGRSILELMTLGAGPGAEIELEATGADAEALVEAVAVLVQKGFEEPLAPDR